jgi:choline dehydrogenase
MPLTDVATQYDFIVCGSGSSGSVVAGRLAENLTASVLLLEAGGDDNIPQVRKAAQWSANLGTDRDWSFVAQPNPHLNGRRTPLSVGRVLGGGSSINVMAWVRGHRDDWDSFAADAGDPSWNYAAVLGIYRGMENWRGRPDPQRRGSDGPVHVESSPDPYLLATSFVEGAAAVGIPSFDSSNGAMMEGRGGAAVCDTNVRDGCRQSAFRAYIAPHIDQPNVRVLTDALVTKLTIEGNRATGVEFRHRGETHRIRAGSEVIVSTGAVQTPKLLMQSGIGDADTLRRFGIPVVAHLPGVGRNYQDHVLVPCIYEYREPLSPNSPESYGTFFWTSDAAMEAPDLQACLIGLPLPTAGAATRYAIPEHGWTLCACVTSPESRGYVELSGPDPDDPVLIHTNMLAEPRDMKATMASVELCQAIADTAPLQSFIRREAVPGRLRGADLSECIRDISQTFWHPTCTAKMGQDAMSVVDGTLKVYGLENVRVADGSIMPRITTGNTMAPCMVIGERAGQILKAAHGL